LFFWVRAIWRGGEEEERREVSEEGERARRFAGLSLSPPLFHLTSSSISLIFCIVVMAGETGGGSQGRCRARKGREGVREQRERERVQVFCRAVCVWPEESEDSRVLGEVCEECGVCAAAAGRAAGGRRGVCRGEARRPTIEV